MLQNKLRLDEGVIYLGSGVYVMFDPQGTVSLKEQMFKFVQEDLPSRYATFFAAYPSIAEIVYWFQEYAYNLLTQPEGPDTNTET